MKFHVGTTCIAFTVLAGCYDQSQELTRPEVATVSPYSLLTTAIGTLQQGDKDRKDTRWQRMNDADFAATVSEAAGRVIVGLKDSEAQEGVDNTGRVVASAAGVRAAKEALKALGIMPLKEFMRIPAIVAIVSPDLAVSLRRNPSVDYVEPSLPGRWESQVTPWNVSKVNAPQAWSLSTGTGAKLLILDSGVDSTERDLYPVVQWRCVDGTLSLYDHLGHGTFVAGVAAALNNTDDVVGASYGVALWSANISTSSYTQPDPAEAACSVDVARVNDIDVVNMSISFVTEYTSLTDEINGGYNYDDMIFVAAAGNSDGGAVTYPATLGNVIAVTATDSTNARASFAAIGSQIDLAAPGVSVLSTSDPGGSVCSTGGWTAVCSGTSYAAPHVSAAAALLRARYAWSNASIRTRLLTTATDLGTSGYDTSFGNGLLNVFKAMGMTVAVSGPTLVYANVGQTWSSSVDGGQTAYAYQWYIDSTSEGTGSTLYYEPGGADFWVKLRVTDALGLVVRDSLYVTVSQCTPPEIFC